MSNSGVQALLMASGLAAPPPGPPTCVADPYYFCGWDCDPYWNDVVLSLHFEGADGSTTFVDSSQSARTITSFVNAQIDTDEFKFGTSSYYSPAAGNNYISCGNGYDFSADFTVEFWWRPYNTTTVGQVLFGLQDGGAGNRFYLVQINNGTNASLGWAIGNGSANSAVFSIFANNWYHIALVRSSGAISVYLDGLLFLGPSTTSTYSPAGTRNLQIGYDGAVGNPAKGHIDDFRVTEGIARYTGNFSVPKVTNPDCLESPWDINQPRTILSLHPDSGADAAIFYAPLTVDEKDTESYQNQFGNVRTFDDPSNVTFTVNGAVFTSTGGFNRIRYGAEKLRPSTQGRIEFSALVTFAGTYVGTDAQFNVFFQVGTVSARASFYARVDAGVLNIYRYNFSGSPTLIGPAAASAEYKIVWTAVNTVTWYIDGVSVGTATETRPSDADIQLTIGFQLSVATSVSTITVKDLQVKIARLVDSSCQNEKFVRFIASADLTTLYSKFGNSSFLIPNTGASTDTGIRIIDHMDFDFGTEDFTIDCWVYRFANTYEGRVWTHQNSTTRVLVGTDGLLDVIYTTSAATYTRTNIAAFPLNQWNHLVVQRNNLTLEIGLNGVLVDSVLTAGTLDSIIDFWLGRENTASARSLNGCIDEFRVTRSVARYTFPYSLDTLPNCNSTIPSTGRTVNGEEYPTGAVATVQQGSMTLLNHYQPLSGQQVSVSQGGVSAGAYSRPTNLVAAYTISRNLTSTAAASFGYGSVLRFNTNGTLQFIDTTSGASNNGSWLTPTGAGVADIYEVRLTSASSPTGTSIGVSSDWFLIDATLNIPITVPVTIAASESSKNTSVTVDFQVRNTLSALPVYTGTIRLTLNYLVTKPAIPPAYPNLNRILLGKIALSEYGERPVITYKTNGDVTLSIIENGQYVETVVGEWIDKNTTYNIATISSQYVVRYGSNVHTLSTPYQILVNTIPYLASVDLLITATVQPAVGNPRYNEARYSGELRVTFTTVPAEFGA